MACRISEDATRLDMRIRAFLSDKETDMVTGIRRMGREPLVDLVMEIAREEGIRCCHPEDASDDAELIVFRHWEGMDADDVRSRWPEADVLFGQDLCHQVPAVVRLR